MEAVNEAAASSRIPWAKAVNALNISQLLEEAPSSYLYMEEVQTSRKQPKRLSSSHGNHHNWHGCHWICRRLCFNHCHFSYPATTMKTSPWQWQLQMTLNVLIHSYSSHLQLSSIWSGRSTSPDCNRWGGQAGRPNVPAQLNKKFVVSRQEAVHMSDLPIQVVLLSLSLQQSTRLGPRLRFHYILWTSPWYCSLGTNKLHPSLLLPACGIYHEYSRLM
jgi:hypothetical protein